MVGLVTTAVPPVDYARFMRTTWLALEASPSVRDRMIDGLPAREAELLRAGLGGVAARYESARRRRGIAHVLLAQFPVTFFAYYALEGSDGMHRFLESDTWRGRATQPGSCYPPAASTSQSFYSYLWKEPWLDGQEDWIREAFRFEGAYLFNDLPAPPRRTVDDGRGVRLVDGAWVAEASFDVPAFGRMLLDFAQEDPWAETLYVAKRRPLPLAVVSLPDPQAERVRRVRLRDQTALALRWLWDDGERVPADATSSPEFRRASDAGLLQPHA